MTPIERRRAEECDAADPLAGFHDRFVIDDPDLIYLCGNSLGRLPKATAEQIQAATEHWGRHLVQGWHQWLDLPTRVGDLLAEHILGARSGEVVVSDSTSVNLYKLGAAALAARPDRRVVVTDDDNFPTDRFIVAGLGAVRPLPGHPVEGPDAESLRAVLDHDVALVSLSHVGYRTSALADMAGLTAVAHEAGAIVLWDLSHSAGCVPIALTEAGVDLAVGCTYKYLNAGPGAPAFLYVRRELQAGLRQPIWGWFGQRDQFAMGPSYDPFADVRQFLVGTPPVLGIQAVRASAAMIAEAGLEAIRDKALALGTLAVDLHDAWLA
ncbi:MAG: aminotransferase class V-fold PLP-dependent enzyme, partial [Actinomycetota bacterium]|nr:aminotransferase class V-fold PLP-dependent enzyme [Actinomycetota bacterium]